MQACVECACVRVVFSFWVGLALLGAAMVYICVLLGGETSTGAGLCEACARTGFSLRPLEWP